MVPERIFDILRKVEERRHLPPTVIFNEGWLLRLILDASDTTRSERNPLSPIEGATWFSEARLRTAFIARVRGDKQSETHTHADGVIGHLTIDPSRRGYTGLAEGATQFIVVEAKMFSGLSTGVRNAPAFHQAARSVACMAQVLFYAKQAPSKFARLAFYVLAPLEAISKQRFDLQMTPAHLCEAVNQRVTTYGAELNEWLEEWFMPLMSVIEIKCLSWESILAELEPVETGSGDLRAFYTACLKYNRPRAKNEINQRAF